MKNTLLLIRTDYNYNKMTNNPITRAAEAERTAALETQSSAMLKETRRRDAEYCGFEEQTFY